QFPVTGGTHNNQLARSEAARKPLGEMEEMMYLAIAVRIAHQKSFQAAYLTSSAQSLFEELRYATRALVARRKEPPQFGFRRFIKSGKSRRLRRKDEL